ncbi:MAG: TonB-dependent receptor [Burkholderiales bacterium]|nr:TonB-dependent receptor [Burkholderiales bacterium]
MSRAGLSGLAAALAAACPAAFGRAGPGHDAERSLPEVTVRASGPQAAMHHVTVLTAQDIARATATSVSELLSTQGNLNLLSYTGNDKKATLDLRGMGGTAANNVLIVVDGVAINENDLSGADLSSLALSQIQRVEIVRGGGSVEHGSGAVAGVIRITTVPSLDEGESRLGLRWRGNDEGDRTGSLHAQRRFGAVSAAAQLERGQARGHRDNAGLDHTLAALTVRWQGSLGPTQADAHVKLTRQRDRYGLPGPVSREAFEGGGGARRASASPLDGGRTEMDRQDLGASLDFGRLGRTQWRSSHRDRFSPFVIGVDASRPVAEQADRITAAQWDHRVSHHLQAEVMGRQQELTLGWSQMQGEHSRSSNGFERPAGTLTLGRASSRATFLAATLRPSEALTLQAGLRGDRFRTQQVSQRHRQNCSYAYIPFPVVIACSPYAYEADDAGRASRWFNRGSELGASWQVTPALSGFVSHSHTFRAPNLDELVEATSTLQPQRGQTREVGVRHRLGEALSWSATLFDIRIHDEIQYGRDPASGRQLNRNLDAPTQRRGVEASLRWRPLPALQLQGQLTHLRPRLVGRSGDIPLVARNTASLTASWQASEAWRWTVAGRFVGPREDGHATGDGTPQPRRLRAHDVWDASVRHQAGDVSWTLGVRNLFDEVYSTQAFSQTYYPMPGRQAHLEVAWGF